MDNEISGGLGNDFIYGKAGDDKLKGGSGSDTIDGGMGFDIYNLTNSYEHYVITKITDDTWLIDGDTVEGKDFINGIERINFGDVTFGDSVKQVLALDVDAGETAGQAYRLYQAAFARTPDGAGVSYHVNDIESNGAVSKLHN